MVGISQGVLWDNCWMSKDQYYCKILNGAENSICLLLAIFKSVLNRTEGYGMKKQKFHQQIHEPANKDYFGFPNNVDSSVSIPKVAHIWTHLIFKLVFLIYWLIHFIIFKKNSFQSNIKIILESSTFLLDFIFKKYQTVVLSFLFY